MASPPIYESHRHLGRFHRHASPTTYYTPPSTSSESQPMYEDSHGHAAPTTYYTPPSTSSESQPMYGDSEVPPCHARHWSHLIDRSHQHHRETDTNLASHASRLPDRLPSPAHDPQEEDHHHNDLVQRRQRRNRDRQHRAMEQIAMNRIPSAVQPERPEGNIVSSTTEIIPNYLPPTLQPDGLEEDFTADTENQQIQHHDERLRNYQQSEARRAQRHSDRPHIMRELWPLDHQLPPAPGDLLDVQSSQMHRGRRVDASMYWPTDHILPPGSEGAGAFTAEAHPRTMLTSLEHSLRMSQLDEILLSVRVELQSLGRAGARATELHSLGGEVARTSELQSLGREVARTTELHPMSRGGARTTELEDDLDDAPPPAYPSPPAYGSWELEGIGLHR